MRVVCVVAEHLLVVGNHYDVSREYMLNSEKVYILKPFYFEGRVIISGNYHAYNFKSLEDIREEKFNLLGI